MIDTPSNGTHNGTPPGATPYTQEQIDRYTELGVLLAWEDLDYDDRLDYCLRNPSVEEWLDDKALDTFAAFWKTRKWAKIKAGYRRLGGDVRILIEAVDALRRDTTGAARVPVLRISARILKAKQLPPLHFVIADILPAGCTLLTAKSKEGKSMLAYNLGVAVASGGLALGKYATMAGSVWYLALEDGERRAQQRLALQEAQMGPLPEEAQDRLEFTFWDAPRLGAGLEEEIRTWIETTPDARLIIIDILEKVRPPRTINGNTYAEDYAATSSLTRLAEAQNVAILILHHSNKSNPADFRDSASGAMSLVGGADNFWSLSRQPLSEEATLKITGRDIPREYDLAMQFKDGYWTALGETRYVTMSEERQALVDVLKDSARPLTPTQIALATGKNVNTMKILLRKMLTATVVMQPTEGHYTLSPSYLATVTPDNSVPSPSPSLPINPINPINRVNPINPINPEAQLIENTDIMPDAEPVPPGAETSPPQETVDDGFTRVYGGFTAEDLTQPVVNTEQNGDTVYGFTGFTGFTPSSLSSSFPLPGAETVSSDCQGGNPPPVVPPPCRICHGTLFWTGAAGQALCCRCHPQPPQRQEP